MDKQALKLNNHLKFWFKYQAPNKEDYKKAVIPIGVIDSVQNFWAFYQHFKRPSQFQDKWETFLFKAQIQPFWEEDANKNGGAFLLKFDKEKADKICEDIMLAFVAKNVNQWNLVNGLRFKIRKEILHIDVWIPDAENV